MAFEVEQLFQSIDIILTQRLQDVHFDKTIICTIVDDSDKKNGCYIVSDGTIKFKAYVSDATYRKDDQVRVSVLNGDFSEKKFITGRYTGNEDTTPITYKSPLESIIPITNNLVTNTLNNNNGVNGLKANGEVIQTELWHADLTSNNEFRDLQSNGIYNTLTIKADFKTLLSKYDLVSGNYGLRLDLFIQPSFDNPTQRIRKYITLDSSEMMGNPYSFSIYSTQAKKVDIMSTGVISEMVLWLYQSINGDGEGRRFTEKNGNEILVNPIIDDILVKNIEIGFGSDIEKVTDNTLEIFTSSPPYYVYQDPTELNNKKEMELLWYNKTEENQYIGFSDGLFDLDYDEINYLKLSNQDARLAAQMGREDIPTDEAGLKLAADLKDSKPLMLKARDALTSDVADVLYSLQRQVKNATNISSKIDELLNTIDGDLVTTWHDANTAIENWNASYVGVLQYARDKQDGENSVWENQWSTDFYEVFVNSIESGIKKVRDFFVWFDGKTQPRPVEPNDGTAHLSAHRGNYDLYSYRMEKELEIIENLLNQIHTLLGGNHSKLVAYHDINYKFHEHMIRDFSGYANKYCIYWYRYEKGYKLTYQKDANNDEYNFGNFVGDGWHRLTDILPNLGLPREQDEKNPGYYPSKSLGQSLSRMMDRNLTEEKYMVVLFYNHEMYKSNIITFTNSEPELIPNDALYDKKDALRIEHDVASMEHYQAYNEFNLLRSLQDGGTVRQLKCFYDGLFRKDEALINASLYWYVPNHSTMLAVDTEALIDEGFNTDAEEQTEYSIAGYTYFYKKVRQCDEEDRLTNKETGEKYYTCRNEDRYFFYKIKPYLEKEAKNNTILVKAYLEGVDEPVMGEITMTFSTFGTNGTKYTLAIVPATSQAAIGGPKSLPLNVSLRDSQNNQIDIVDANLVTEGRAGYGFRVESWKGLPNAFAWDILPAGRASTDPITGLSVFLPKETLDTWNAETPYFGIINASVNFKIDKNEDLEESEKVSEYQKYRVLDLNTLYAIPYSSSELYYMSGATHIVYNNQGVISYVSEDKYELYTVNDKGNTPVENQVWSMRYYNSKGEWITEGHKDWAMLVNYMPVLNSENRLTPAPLYIDNLDYVPVVICTIGNTIAWAQPIIVTQNRYVSSTLNDWNGSFTIDEKNGTILATALGAGKKEDDNSFSGVLMGDIGKGTNFDADNMDGLGLYGFNKGAQSFCLSSQGTAFFGKAGRGRIYFDGESGTIASASYEMVRRNFGELDAAGMLIDMDDGFIHMLGSVYSEESGEYSPGYGEGGSSQAEILISTGLVNNLPEAYLKIRSKNQANKDHYLMYIDDKDYYLQTDNYEEFEFNEIDGEASEAGNGFRLDLKDGILDGYNFRLSSKNVMINSSEKSNAFFIIKNDEGKNLFYAGPKEYYIQSSDYNGSDTGIKINLMSYGNSPSGIEAYNFKLCAGNVLGDYAIVLSDDANQYFKVNTEVNGVKKTLVSISKNEQLFQSSDYNGVDTGIRLSLSDKELKAYSGFTLKAYNANSTDNYIEIDAQASTNSYPLRVSNNFKVDWVGNLTCVGMNANNANLSGTLNVGDELIVKGTLSGGTIEGATIEGGVLKVGPSSSDSGYQLYADSNEVTIQNATIKNCTIENSSIENGDGSSTGFSMPATGLGSLINTGTFEDCYVAGNLTVGTSGVEGASATGNIILAGNAIYFGSDTSSGYLRYEEGKVVIMNYGLYVSEVITFVNYCNGIYCLGDCETYPGGNPWITLMSDTSLYTGKTFTISSGATLNIADQNGLNINGKSLTEIVKEIIKDSVSISVVSNADDTTVTGGKGGVYTVTTTDNKNVTASQTICCYTYTQPSGGYFTTTETTDSPPSGTYYTYCTKDKTQQKDISTSGSIKATVTIKD